MPKFEDINSITPNVYSNLKYRTMKISTYITGARVKKFVKLVLVAHKMNMFRRIIPFWCNNFQFQNENHYGSMIELRVVDRLETLNQK